jgi:trk system potassium uptake protein TrkA
MTKTRILAIGLGRMGTALVEQLLSTDVDVIVVDKRADALGPLRDRVSAAIVADAAEPRVLQRIGAAEVHAAAVTYGRDFESAALTVSALAEMGVPAILARAANARQAAALRATGATRVVLVESEMGQRLAADVLLLAKPPSR